MEENFVKVVNATYKLLEFFPDNDPLKYKAKEKALTVLENLTLISEVSGWISFKKEKATAELLDDIEVLKSYMQLGKHQGWVGGINYLILLKEYNKIKDQIKPPEKSIKKTLEITLKLENTSLTIEKSKKYEKPETIEDLINLKPIVVPPLSSAEAKESPRNQRLSLQPDKAAERHQKILEIINNMGKAQVSDIIKEIPNITKRTIRRDLDELLKKAKIIRNGEWNRVSYQIYPFKSI